MKKKMVWKSLTQWNEVESQDGTGNSLASISSCPDGLANTKMNSRMVMFVMVVDTTKFYKHALRCQSSVFLTLCKQY